VKPNDIDQYVTEFESFHARFARFFVRSEPREAVGQYLRGLLSPVSRKNCWQMAEAVGDKDPQAMQRLLFGALWDADAVRDELQGFVVERFGEADGIGIVDETGFLKKGTKSVGVKRQYSGTAGKVENCQIGVFLTYCTGRGTTFLDRRLYLPAEWCQDGARRRGARVPEEVVFQTKPQLAIQMLGHAWARGVPMEWVTGDTIYGDDTWLRDQVAQARKKYVLAVSANTPVWRERQAVVTPVQGQRGRPRKEPRLADGAKAWDPVSVVIAALPRQAWQRLAVGRGEKGPRLYDWARVRVFEKRGAVPGRQRWLLARRSIADPTELAYYLSNAPRSTSLRTLAEVAGARWGIESAIEEGKGETGLDEYEVRYWHSWHRHITLSMMAHAYLASIRQPGGGKSARPGDGRTECA
jgi:SRSO17 transposase